MLYISILSNCETDFVARRSEFQNLAKDIAMQIASGTDLRFVSTKDIPEEFVKNEEAIELGVRFSKNNI